MVASPEGATWDVLEDGYGPDVENLAAALGWALSAWKVDTERVALAGFSDGASYALTIGLKNGDLFTHVLAFSPGFVLPAMPVGLPAIRIAHGDGDQVLPVSCSEGIVRSLAARGYEVMYKEFDGGHTVPDAIAGWALSSLDPAGTAS